MGSTFIPFEDTPAWESGLRVHEAENKWLLREVDAVLTASRAYTRSLTPSGAFGGGFGSFGGTFGDEGNSVVDTVGGMLAGALAGMESLAVGTPGGGGGGGGGGRDGGGGGDGGGVGFESLLGAMGGGSPGGAKGGDGGEASGGGVGGGGGGWTRPAQLSASAEAAFAAALERVGTVAASTPEEEEMAAPMAASVGAPLLAPVADTLRAIGALRETLGRRVNQCLVHRLQAFIDEDLASVVTMRERFERERSACDAARAHYLSSSGGGGGPKDLPNTRRSRAAEENDKKKRLYSAAKESLEAARARLALATCNVEGRRRYVLLEAMRETMTSLLKFFEDGVTAMGGLAHNLKALEEYEMASRAQAEMKMEWAARQMEAAFSGLGEGDDDEEQAYGDDDDDDKGGEGGGGGDRHHRGARSRGTGEVGGAITSNNMWEEVVGDGAGGGGSLVDDEWSRKDGGGGMCTGYTTGKHAGGGEGGGGGGERYALTDSHNLNSFGTASTYGMNTGRSADESIRKTLAEGQEARETNRGLGVPVIRRGYLSQRMDGDGGGGGSVVKWSGGLGGGKWTRRYFVLDSMGQLTVHSAVGGGRRGARPAPSHARAAAAAAAAATGKGPGYASSSAVTTTTAAPAASAARSNSYYNAAGDTGKKDSSIDVTLATAAPAAEKMVSSDDGGGAADGGGGGSPGVTTASGGSSEKEGEGFPSDAATAAAAVYGSSPPDRGVLVPMAATAMKSVGGALGAAWSFVAKGAAPEPISHYGGSGGGGGGNGGGGDGGFGFDGAGGCGGGGDSEVQVAVDLTVSCVKLGADPSDRSSAGRPFCFRIISPAVSLLLQAESNEEMHAWVRDLQGVIAELISLGPSEIHRRSGSGSGGGGEGLQGGGKSTFADEDAEDDVHRRRQISSPDPREILSVVAGNLRCADCGREENPDWASLNLCVIICQRCAGVHRHLGAHVSKVRSLKLDKDAWTDPVVALFAAVGNDAANSIWEAKRREGIGGGGGGDDDNDGDFVGFQPEFPPPVASDCSSFEEALDAISGKYVRREHVQATVELRAMEKAAAALDCLGVLRRLAATSSAGTAGGIGAEVAGGMEKSAALLAAVKRGDEGAAVVTLLLSNGARVDGSGGGNNAGGGGGGGAGDGGEGGVVLPVVAAAIAAGCRLEGTVVGLLRTAADVQGVLLNIPPDTTATTTTAAVVAAPDELKVVAKEEEGATEKMVREEEEEEEEEAEINAWIDDEEEEGEPEPEPEPEPELEGAP